MITANVVTEIPLVPTYIEGIVVDRYWFDDETFVVDVAVTYQSGPEIDSPEKDENGRSVIGIDINTLNAQCECGNVFGLCHPEA